MQQQVTFPSGTVNYIYRTAFADMMKDYDKQHTVIITNEHLARIYDDAFKGYTTLVVPATEGSKDMDTVRTLAAGLLQAEATRRTTIIAVGGGVVTDIAGFVASVYMRGVRFGFVPTTLLGMVDAAIGGKNGVNLGYNKNVLGTINQPAFVLFDTAFLDTLPATEWSNGFAEVIKYACIFDKELFDELGQHDISYYRHNPAALNELIERCARLKTATVVEDEKEAGVRKLLNFGHTAAHAIENLYELPHGKAVAIGMVIACMVSETITGLGADARTRLMALLQRYNLPVKMNIDPRKAMEILRMDKKRHDDKIDYIVLERIGKAAIHALPFTDIENALIAYES
jgi:3-dehydroquinate synthase